MTTIEAKALALVAVGKIEARLAAAQQERGVMCQAMISDAEIENLILGIMRQRPDRRATEQEVADMVNECVELRVLATCVDMAARGLIDVDLDPSLPPNERLVFRQRTDLQDAIRDALIPMRPKK